jgi:2-keto-4-pentenoate hydratase/2-oxohepta-3-ene-1,7-dioic acid hydratase in catechol pathway
MTRLVTFAAQGRRTWGVLDGDQVVDAPRLAIAAGAAVPADVLTLLSTEGGVDHLRDLLHSNRERSAFSVPADTIRLLPPIPRPGKILAIGRNYLDHASEASLTSLPEWPKLFPLFPSNVIGPQDSIVRPTMTAKLDWEVEVGVVIGRRAVHVPESEAPDYIAGYTVINDISARDVQLADEQLTLGKNFATFCPMGPALTLVDELPDPADIHLRLRLNGVQMQSASTASMIFSIPYLVAFLSYVMPLEPGDVIATGTPAGVGVFRNPPVALQPGDLLEAEIDGVGTLTNRVVAGTGSPPLPAHRTHLS